MYKEGNEIYETGDEARDAVDIPGMTWVLFGGIGLVMVAFAAVWFFAGH